MCSDGSYEIGKIICLIFRPRHRKISDIINMSSILTQKIRYSNFGRGCVKVTFSLETLMDRNSGHSLIVIYDVSSYYHK